MNLLERDYYTIEAIELMPEASQRDLAKYTGMSLGKVNYCLKELAQKGWIKAQEIQRTDGRGAGLYLLTAKGLAAQSELIHNFLAYKMGSWKSSVLKLIEFIKKFGEYKYLLMNYWDKIKTASSLVR